MHACMHTHTHIHMHARMHIHTHTHTHTQGLSSSSLNADEWIKRVAETMEGKGGGSKMYAQAYSHSVDKLPTALEAAREFARLKLQ